LGKNIFTMCHTGKALLDFLVATVILSVLVIIASSVFYKLIERPCMDKYWHKKLWLTFPASSSKNQNECSSAKFIDSMKK